MQHVHLSMTCKSREIKIDLYLAHGATKANTEYHSNITLISACSILLPLLIDLVS